MYEGLAEFYEWEHRDFRDDVPLYLGFAGSVPGAILDAGCGTGRLLIPLAKAGYAVTGVDRSADMLRLARANLAREGMTGDVGLLQGDLRTMDLGRRFTMALVALGSFNHLLTMEDQRAALGRLAAHLEPRRTSHSRPR